MARRKSSALFSIGSAMGAVFLLSLLAPLPLVQAGGVTSDTTREAPDAASAFASAKELGTAEAWQAFLANYPTGFHADLARAYLKKLEGQPSPTIDPSSEGEAQELACRERDRLRSGGSERPTKLTFINISGMYRSLLWIDGTGALKDYGGLNHGERITLDTFVGHPWMVATGPGDCLQIFLPDSAPATVELIRLAVDDGPPRPLPKRPKHTEKPPAKKQKLVCGANYRLRKGACVLIQNCGKNAYRSPEGDCYCKKNYVMKNGVCAWKTDKQGFEVAPWKKGGCKNWQRQCSQGNNTACGQYEANCQVN